MAYVRDKWIGENLAFGTVCRVGRRFPSLAPKVAKLVTSAAAERELIDRSDRIFCSPRHVHFVEMEYGIPFDAVPDAIGRINDLVSTLAFPPLFPIEVRASAADDIPLSTANGRASGWIAIHQYVGAPYEAYFQGVEQIMNDYAGRPHWGKLHYQSSHTLAHRYPEWQTFRDWRGKLDPTGTFRNPYLDRVLGRRSRRTPLESSGSSVAPSEEFGERMVHPGRRTVHQTESSTTNPCRRRRGRSLADSVSRNAGQTAGPSVGEQVLDQRRAGAAASVGDVDLVEDTLRAAASIDQPQVTTA